MSNESSAPSAVVVRDRGSLWLWALPLVAAIATGLLVFQAWKERGPLITIEFADGAGIADGDPVIMRGVRIGDVRSVGVSKDLTRVVVQARLRRDAAEVAVDGTEFWIVRPEISAGRIAGLETLLGPRYLQCSPGSGPPSTRFSGLDQVPGARGSAGTLEIVIEATECGSLGVDTPVAYRGIRVGTVRDVGLTADARRVELTLVIEGPYRGLVRENSRFWNAGGLGVDWGLIRGLKMKASSLEMLVGGGIAFATPTKPGEPAQSGHRFVLADAPKEEWLQWSPDIGIKTSER